MGKYIRIVPYVIHEHDAKRAGHHLDFRIKFPNKNLAASWAIPKGEFPRKPGEKVLAVRTNDHGRYWLYIDNLTIPEGEYGAGTIKILQKGKAEIYGWSDKHITFVIKGSVANGRYSIIKFNGRKEDKGNTWVLIKTKPKD